MANFSNQIKKAPALFIGHGSPLNIVEQNEFSRGWDEISKKLVTLPIKAIVILSAHWYTSLTRVNDMPNPPLVYDIYGFPKSIYSLKYPVNGNPELAQRLKKILGKDTQIDNSWGLDHGVWGPLLHLFPEANIPLVQVSIDRMATPAAHFRLGKILGELRKEGIMIIGSGDIVHNLSFLNWDKTDGYPWADEFDAYVKSAILSRDYQKTVNFQKAGLASKYAFVTPEHYAPLLYVLGAAFDDDQIEVFNDRRIFGSVSMTSYLFS
ncbi:MAG: 4,5-DOPA dioxygenase extradiol [Bacilli bacterium]|jgi:4,5-DOPA dioxygenase extradiol|nr:4,5-DOPA dioxygenase extradiol [Bacilli bacterium]